MTEHPVAADVPPTAEHVPASPIPDPRPPAAGRRLLVASTVLAWAAVATFVAGVTLLAIPVSNRHVQSCGAPGLFLLRGTPDASLYDSSGNPIHGFDQKALQRAADHRCSNLVADRGAPAAALGAAFVLLSLAALVLVLLGRHRARRADLAEWAASLPPTT